MKNIELCVIVIFPVFITSKEIDNTLLVDRPILVDKSIVDEYVFKKASKHWHQYVVKFLSKTLKLYFHALKLNFFVPQEIENLYNQARIFVKVHKLEGGHFAWKYEDMLW